MARQCGLPIHVTVSLLVMVRRPVGGVLEDTPQRGCFQAVTKPTVTFIHVMLVPH